MTTPPPDTKVQSETLEQIAERIAKRFIGSGDNIEMRRQNCAGAIVEALRNERERAAKLCDKEAAEWVETARNYSALDPMRNSCLSRAEMAEELAKAIREGR